MFENNNQLDDKLLLKYDGMLKEFVYDKIWSELSNVEKQIVKVISKSETKATGSIQDELGMKKTTFSSFRDKLIKNGIIHSTGWGFVDFTLPRFKEYIDIILQFE